MKNLFEKETRKEILNRINQLNPSSVRQWGEMDVSQMFAHCTSSLRLVTGERKPSRILLCLGITIGSFFKSTYYNDKPFKKNVSTTKASRITDKRDFHFEKEALIKKIIYLTEEGIDACEKHPHPYFGYLTSAQWGTGIYKHLDHHLRQFDV